MPGGACRPAVLSRRYFQETSMHVAQRSLAAVGLTTLLLSAAVATAPALAQATGSMIFPKRVVFTGRARSAEVTLVNSGSQPVTYRVDLIDQRMTAAGGLEAPAEPVERSATGLLRYSPRQVTVPPGSSQTVRLLLRKPADLPPGEYRAHLLCRTLPPEDQVADVESLKDGKNLAVRVVPLPAVSIPVIVRHGDDLRAAVRLSGLSFDASRPALSFRLEREGGASVYGDLTATFQPTGGGPEHAVLRVRGVSVYSELPAIEQSLTLQAEEGVPLAHGRLRLRFLSRPADDGGGPQVSAEAELQVP
jgi:hypothetical protein